MDSVNGKALPPLPQENTPISKWKRAIGLIMPKSKASTAASTPQITSTNNANSEMPRAATSLGHNIEPFTKENDAHDGTPPFDYAYHYDREGYYRHGSSSSILNLANSTEEVNANDTSEETLRKRNRRRLPIYRHSLTSGFIFSSSTTAKEKEKETASNRNTIGATSPLLTNQGISEMPEAAGAAAALTRAEKRAKRREEKQRRKDLAGLTYAYAFGYGGMALKQQLHQQQHMQTQGRPESGFSYSVRGSQVSKLSLFSWEEKREGLIEGNDGDNGIEHQGGDMLDGPEELEHEHEHEHKEIHDQEHLPVSKPEHVHEDQNGDAAEMHGRPDGNDNCTDNDNGHSTNDNARQWKLNLRSRSRKRHQASPRKANPKSRSRSRARHTRLMQRHQMQTLARMQGQDGLQVFVGDSHDDCNVGDDGDTVKSMLAAQGESRLDAEENNGSAEPREETLLQNEGAGMFGLGIDFNGDNFLTSAVSSSSGLIAGGGISRIQSQSTPDCRANLSQLQSQLRYQTSQSTTSAGVILDTTSATADKLESESTGGNIGVSESNCCSEGCRISVDTMYLHRDGYPPVPQRHPDHRYNIAETSAMASPTMSTGRVPNTSAGEQDVTAQPTTTTMQMTMTGTSMIGGPATDDGDRDQHSASLYHYCNRARSNTAPEDPASDAGALTSASVLAGCGGDNGRSDENGLDATDDSRDDSGDDLDVAERQTSPTHPCGESRRQVKLQQLSSHKASRCYYNSCRSCSAGAFEFRPGQSAAVIQQQTEHEEQYYSVAASNVDAPQLIGNTNSNLVLDHERLGVAEFSDREDKQGGKRRKVNREDNLSSRFNLKLAHLHQPHHNHSRHHLLQSDSCNSTDQSERTQFEDKKRTSALYDPGVYNSEPNRGNKTNSRDMSDLPVSVTSARRSTAKAIMFTKAFFNDREEYPKQQTSQSFATSTCNTSPTLSNASTPSHPEIASAKCSGHGRTEEREHSDGYYLCGPHGQSLDDLRLNPLRSHPVHAGIQIRPVQPRATSCSFLSVQQQGTQPKNTHTVSDHQDQHQHNGLEASTSQPSMIGSESSHASSKRLPSTTKGDRENIITRSLVPLKTSTFLHRSDGKQKLKKSQSLSPLASGGQGLRELACGEMDNASTDSVNPSPHWPTDFWKRGQSTDCLKYTRPTTASKRIKDLHRKACVSPLKISFPSELMDDVPLPIYPGSASSTSSHLYYSCNEEYMQNGSVVALPGIGKNSMDGVISPPRRQSPLMTEYESSSDISTSDDEEVEVCEVKIESARRVRHRRVNAVEIKQIDIKPRLPLTPPMRPIQTPVSPVLRTLPQSIPRRRIQKRNMDALNRFTTRRSSSDPIQAPLTPPEDRMLSHSVSHPSLPKRPALHRGAAFRHSHSCPESTINFPSMACLPEEEVNKMRQQMQSSSSSASDQSSWSHGSDASDASMQTFVDLKDASFVFD